MKILNQIDENIIILCVICLILGILFISWYPAKSQSLNSNSYYNYLFLSFLKARSTYKVHDANVLKALLMVQGNPAAKIKLGKMCIKFIEDEGLKDK